MYISSIYLWTVVIQSLGHVQLFVVPRTVARQVPLSMGLSRQEYWSGLPCLPLGDLPNPGIEPASQVSCIGRQVLCHQRHQRSLYIYICKSVQFSHSVVSDSVMPWTAACQASLSITNSRSLLKPTSTESMMPSNQLILCRPLLLPPSIFPSISLFK